MVELAANNAFNNDILSFKISEGNCTQTITLPAQSVWCSVCLENGDFAVGSRYISDDCTQSLSKIDFQEYCAINYTYILNLSL